MTQNLRETSHEIKLQSKLADCIISREIPTGLKYVELRSYEILWGILCGRYFRNKMILEWNSCSKPKNPIV